MLGIGYSFIPTLIYKTKQVKELGLYDKTFKPNKVLGYSWSTKDNKELEDDIIYLNVGNTDYLSQIIDTLVHELLHLKYPNLKHGKEFQNKINGLMMSI